MSYSSGFEIVKIDYKSTKNYHSSMKASQVYTVKVRLSTSLPTNRHDVLATRSHTRHCCGPHRQLAKEEISALSAALWTHFENIWRGLFIVRPCRAGRRHSSRRAVYKYARARLVRFVHVRNGIFRDGKSPGFGGKASTRRTADLMIS